MADSGCSRNLRNGLFSWILASNNPQKMPIYNIYFFLIFFIFKLLLDEMILEFCFPNCDERRHFSLYI